MIGEKLRYYRDKTFKSRRQEPLPLPAPFTTPLPDAPSVTARTQDTEAAGGTIERADGGGERYASAESLRAAIDDIPVPRGQPTDEDMQRMAEALAQITHYATPEALAAFAAAA